jgi:hypothetical protein
MRGFVFIAGSNFYHKFKNLTADRKHEFPLSSFDFHFPVFKISKATPTT